MRGFLGDFRVAFCRYGDDDASSRLDFLDVAENLPVGVDILRRDHHDGHLLVNQCDGAVLHLCGRIALSVDVGDLLELERPFQRDGEIHAPSKIERIGLLMVKLCAAHDLPVFLQDRLDLKRYLPDAADHRLNLRVIERFFLPGERNSQEVQDR